jgi:hypothetical protein
MKPTDERQQDQCNITLEEGQELLGAIRAHIKTMAKKTLEALDMTLYAQGAVEEKIPWYRGGEDEQGGAPLTSLLDRTGEGLEQDLAVLLAEDYEMPENLVGLHWMLFIGLNFYRYTLDRPDFYICEDIPKLLAVDEKMSEIFLMAGFIFSAVDPFTTNMARMKATNRTRQEGTDQDVFAAIEKLKAGDPENRERYTKTAMAGAIFKTIPGPLPTLRTIQYSLERLFFKRKGATKRGERFSLHDLTE